MTGFQALAQAWRLADLDDFQMRSQARLAECTAFLEATDSNLTAAAQLLAFGTFVQRYDESPLAVLLQQQATALVTETEPIVLAERAVCDRLDGLSGQGLVAADAVPELWWTCGQTYGAEADYASAVAAYQRLLQDFPTVVQIPQVETALAAMLIAQARAEGSGEIAQPGWSGYTGSSLTEVTIRNDSPERMRIVFSGPEPRFEEIAPCENCQTYIGEGPETCPNQGPVATFTLQPGDYEVLVRSVSDPTVNPFTGNWALAQGEAYNNCFYLVESPSPESQ
jgi:hypothetical protein